MKSVDRELIGTINLNEKKNSIIMIAIFAVIAIVGAGVLLYSNLISINRINIFVIICMCFAYVALHELIHIVVMKIFARERVQFSIQFPTISIGSDYLFSRFQYIVIAIAPCILFGVIITASLIAVPYDAKFLVSILLILNFAASSGDYMSIFYALRYSKDHRFQDNSKVINVYQ